MLTACTTWPEFPNTGCLVTTFYVILILNLCHNFNTILIICIYIYIYIYIWNDVNILPLIFDNLYRTLVAPEDCCVLQLKHVGAIKPIVQLVGNKLVCTRQLHEKCTIINPSCNWL